MSWIITGDEKNGLLDIYPGAAAAYSLRNLQGRSGKNSAVVRVRRDNDDAEQDFTATEVSDGTLAAWVGAGNDGFVRTWYDQSGNGNDAEQATTATQPAIVLSGSLVTQGSKPAISTGAVTDSFLSVSGGISASNYTASIFIAAKSNVATYTSGTGSARLANAAFDGTDNRFYFGTRRPFPQPQSILSANYDVTFYYYSSAATFGTSPFVFSSTATATFAAAHFNSQQCFSGSISPSNTGITSQSVVVGGSGSNYWDGLYQEFVLYQSDQSSNRAAIEANINAHYSIF
jgi:hypothetical protein